MTEAEARAWIAARFGEAAADRIAALLDLVISENYQQNLIAPSTVAQIWVRHALDSAQLVPLGRAGRWLDVGTGGGFPGLVVALLRSDPVTLVEPRRRRAEFLQRCVDRLSLAHVDVHATKVEALCIPAATISARAVTKVENLLHAASGCRMEGTRWLLPRGRLSEADLTGLRRNWNGVFHVEQSLTDPASSILVLNDVTLR